jgi:hypothetical protein
VLSLASLFPFGRGRPSVRASLGDQTGKLMSIEASITRIEAQNAVIAEVLVGVFEVQKTHTDMLKTLSAAAPGAIDTTDLDASIADTDAKLATLMQPAASGTTATAATGAAGTGDAGQQAAGTTGAAAADPATPATGQSGDPATTAA